MQHGQIFVDKSTQARSELIPFCFEEYVDGYGPVAFPPPNIG
jgi:hypothetical protein